MKKFTIIFCLLFISTFIYSQKAQLSAVGITASTTQTQVGGTPIIALNNWVETVANTSNAVRIDIPARPGNQCTITNSGANTMKVFPEPGSNFNIDGTPVAVNGYINIASGNQITFYCAITGEWRNQLTFDISKILNASSGAQISAAAASLGTTTTLASPTITGTVTATGRIKASGVIRDSIGAVGIPSYSAVSYPTNGMYFPSSVQLGFAVGGILQGGWNASGLFTGNITEQTTGSGITFANQTFQLRTATTFTVSHTIGADSLIKGGITIASGTCTITLPTGTALTTATGATTNYGFDVDLNNVASGGTLTIVVNTGIVAASALTGGTTLTLSNSATVGYGRIHFQAISANNWVISRTI